MGYCRARLTPFGRKLLVDRILELGWPVAQAAESVGVSRQTAYRWMRRWREEGEAGLEDRSSRPHHSPGRVSLEMEKRIVSDRITEKEGPHLMAGRLGVPRSTIYGVLARRGLSRLCDLDRTTGTPIRYVKDCPGELVHVDIKKLGKIPDGGGWRVLGRSKAGPKQKVGYEYVHSMVDDHTRMAYSQSPRLPGRPNLRRVHAPRRSVVRDLRVSHRPSDDRQRHGLPPKPSLRRCPRPDRRRSRTDPTLPSPDQRQSATLPPNPPRRMGLQTTLHHQPTTPPSPHQIPQHLQSPQTPQLTRRPTTHHPTCNSPLWEGHGDSPVRQISSSAMRFTRLSP